MHEIHFRIRRVKRPAMHAPARRTPNHDRRRSVPQVMSLSHEICNLVEGAHDEIDELHLADRPQPQIAHPASRANDGALADRRIDHPLPAKFFEQALAGLERTTVDANVLADQHHGRIALHLLKHGLLDGLEKGYRPSAIAIPRPSFGRIGHDYLRPFLAPLAATFATALRLVAPASLPALFSALFPPRAPFFETLAAGFPTFSDTISIGVAGASLSSFSFRSSVAGVSPK